MRRLNIICLIVMVFAIVGYFAKTQRDYQERHHAIVRSLQENNLTRARAFLHDKHDWNLVLSELATLNDPALYQRALTVHFLYDNDNYYDGGPSYPEHIDVIKKLVSHGAIPTHRNLVDAIQQSKTETVLYFLEQGVPVDGTAKESSALVEAAYSGNTQLVRVLLKKGASINQIEKVQNNNDRWCPLLAAASRGQGEVTKLLLKQGADPMLLSEKKIPVWKSIRQFAHSYGYPATTETWHIVKPVVEKRLGHPVPD